MAPAPKTSPAPKTAPQSSRSSSSPPPATPPPSPPKSRPPPSPSDSLSPKNSRGYSPPPSPPSETSSSPSPPKVRPTRGNASNKAPSSPSSKLNNPSSRKSPSKSSTDSYWTSNSTTNSSVTIIGGIAAAAAILAFLAIVIFCVLCNRKKKKPYYLPEEPPGVGGGGPYYNGKADHVVKFGTGGGGWGQPPPMNTGNEFPGSSPNMPLAFSKSQFSYDELAAATGGFSQFNLLGQGGFGYVNKGVLPNGKEVAVKSLKAGSGQGEREFQAEVEIISRVHHRHLVSLVGYCISDAQRMLVYEYVPNKTLEFHLHGKGPVMDWRTRVRIALGSAKGLAYLHEDCHPSIIHRDIKSANILLDHNYEAKVADFGLAKLTSANDTHVSTRVMGTFGYLAPEYASSGKLTEKSDVFSFGVMLLEILTGRKPVDPTSDDMDDSLVDWARPLIAKAKEDGDYSKLVDPRLEGNYDHDEIARMASCAAAGVRHSAKRRPKMSRIVRALEGDASLDILDKKATSRGSTLNSGNETKDYDTMAYNDDMMEFRKMVMSSQERPSREYNGLSSSNNGMGNSGAPRKTLYPAINKPAAVLQWLNHAQTDADFIVTLDADMITMGIQRSKRGPVSTSYETDTARYGKYITIYESGWITEMYGYSFGAASDITAVGSEVASCYKPQDYDTLWVAATKKSISSPPSIITSFRFIDPNSLLFDITVKS
ncbi:hypothetical protein L6452_10389 [Arctium lappa]|uniref:Uncharacterized protein n=1 Tax=Arctium lappa TaxID=4217 RepID=A0ACB9DM89_ARCLA|nr:hypothetical protein L6452_10389 [Arctium lappa]